MQTAMESQNHRGGVDSEDRMRERRFIVNWIKEQLSQRPEKAEKEAFLCKHKFVLVYHGIKREEIID